MGLQCDQVVNIEQRMKAMRAQMEHDLTEPAKQWLIGATHRNEKQARSVSIEHVERLYGGTSSLMHRVTVQVDGKQRAYVLRQFDNAEWLAEEPDVVTHEAQTLRLLSKWRFRSSIAVPRVIDYDPTGNGCGLPAVLMTSVPGHVVLQPSNRDQWLDHMAKVLAEIHHIHVPSFQWHYFRYMDMDVFDVPTWSAHPQLWTAAIDIVQQRPPQSPICLIHRDYHPGNILWEADRNGETIRAIVDWVNACLGPAGVDLGHARVNLVQLHGVECADAFLEAYAYYAGASFRYEAYWDLVSLIDILFGVPTVDAGWQALGVQGLTDELVRQRLDQYFVRVMERVK